MDLIRTVALRLLAVPAMAPRPIEPATLAWPARGRIAVPVAQPEVLTRLVEQSDRRMLC